MWQNKKTHLSQANSKPIISPWSVPIGGGGTCILTGLALHKVLLAVTWCPVAFKGTGNWLNFKLSSVHPGFLIPDVNLVLLLDKADKLVKNWPGIYPGSFHLFFFPLLKKRTHIHYSVGQKKKNPKSICWLPKWIESILFLIYSLWEVLSTDN